jgi:hypothetical protein
MQHVVLTTTKEAIMIPSFLSLFMSMKQLQSTTNYVIVALEHVHVWFTLTQLIEGGTSSTIKAISEEVVAQNHYHTCYPVVGP